eukprot:TRINITY_DN15726_c0_g1_i1.p1 TRINITY_DN15726_c0_g1~~TRINITY_DN15726_c0_g1_i1.p1  ORF type:complete len:359 (-),score=45.01 TRINITY_DN15726_c0_g1_i1:14-1039(-)
MATLYDVPVELLHLMCLQLPIASIGNLICSSRYLRDILNEDVFWKSLLLCHGMSIPSAARRKKKSCKWYFKMWYSSTVFVLAGETLLHFRASHWTTCPTTACPAPTLPSRRQAVLLHGVPSVISMCRPRLFVFNLEQQVWSPLPDLVSKGFVSHNNVLYAVASGRRSRKIHALYPSETRWTCVYSGLDPGAMTCEQTIALIDDKIYISSFWSTECYDIASNASAVVSGTSPPACGVCVYRGKMYTAGGLTADSTAVKALKMFRCYDPASDQWTQLADMSIERVGCVLVVYRDRVWVIGGISGAQPSVLVTAVESYDAVKNTWRQEMDLPLVDWNNVAAIVK